GRVLADARPYTGPPVAPGAPRRWRRRAHVRRVLPPPHAQAGASPAAAVRPRGHARLDSTAARAARPRGARDRGTRCRGLGRGAAGARVKLGHTTVLVGERAGKYPEGNSLLVQGGDETVIVDPSLAVADGRFDLPRIDRVLQP